MLAFAAPAHAQHGATGGHELSKAASLLQFSVVYPAI